LSGSRFTRLAVLVFFAVSTQSVSLFEAVEALASLQGEAHHHDSGGCVDPCADGSACGDGCPCMCCPGHGPVAVVQAPGLALLSQPAWDHDTPYRADLNPTQLPESIFHPPR
jgi:hypothetical protein